MKRKPELDYMNAIACLLVILIHVLSVGIVEAEPSSFCVQTRTRGSGEVRAVACPMLISFMVKTTLSQFYSAQHL